MMFPASILTTPRMTPTGAPRLTKTYFSFAAPRCRRDVGADAPWRRKREDVILYILQVGAELHPCLAVDAVDACIVGASGTSCPFTVRTPQPTPCTSGATDMSAMVGRVGAHYHATVTTSYSVPLILLTVPPFYAFHLQRYLPRESETILQICGGPHQPSTLSFCATTFDDVVRVSDLHDRPCDTLRAR